MVLILSIFEQNKCQLLEILIFVTLNFKESITIGICNSQQPNKPLYYMTLVIWELKFMAQCLLYSSLFWKSSFLTLPFRLFVFFHLKILTLNFTLLISFVLVPVIKA